MLTVVVTGRNDAHGYNLHKRVALSLNSVAEMLGNDAEIIFVDWNSPDEMPTIVEAIADTLTERCRRLLRLLRVRPSQHLRVRGVSHLPLIDTIARNVAIRRARSENTWLLSTSTDVILAPRRPGRTLADVASQLDPALYHVPRFDVPESLWETLDRRDPVRAREMAVEWGHSLRLHEVVEAHPVVKYDGPGDFQLLPLAAMRQLCGFDERMVLTYHSDSNLAKRAGFLLGPVRSLSNEFLLYHCNHYRQVSVHHGMMRAENSWQRFFDEVSRPDIPSQAANWGLSDDDIEEIPVAPLAAPRIAAVLNDAQLPNCDDSWTVINRSETYNELDYRPAHVLPFVVDLLDTLPRNARLGIMANGSGLLTALASVWQSLGFEEPVLVSDRCLPPASSPVEIASETDIFDQAAALLFDFSDEGTTDPFGDAAVSAHLDAVSASFRRAVARERERAGNGESYRQRFIIVNAINTVFERLVSNNLAYTYTPFTGRVRHGIVVLPPDPLATDIASLAAWLGKRVMRAGPVPYQEVVDALDLIVEHFAAGTPAPAAGAVTALLEHPRLSAALKVDPGRWRSWSAASLAARPASSIGARLRLPLTEPALDRPPAANKVAAIEDWERPGWLVHLARCEEAADSVNGLRRHRTTWETGQFLYAVDTAGLTTLRSARVVLRGPSTLPVYLSRQIPAVEVSPADPTIGIGGIWPPHALPYDRERLTCSEAMARPVDLIVVPGNAVLARTTQHIAATLAELDASLNIGGVLTFAAEVVLAGDDADDRLPAECLASGELERCLRGYTGYVPVGNSDWSVSGATLDRLAVAGTPGETQPHFVIQIGDLFSTTAILTWRKTEATSQTGWTTFGSILAKSMARMSRRSRPR